MMRWLTCLMLLWSCARADEAVEPTMELSGKSWFVGQPFEALVSLPFEEEPVAEWPEETGDFQLIDVVVDVPGEKEAGGYVAHLRWVPRRAGILTLPSVRFVAGESVLESPMRQFVVSEPRETEEMTLRVEPERRTVYVGQPLRVDVTWSSELRLGSLRGLRLHPSFFNDSSIEVVVPRPTGPEGEQLGLPIGGRRVIAQNKVTSEKPGAPERPVGDVRFSLYLRFSEPGEHTLEPAKLECARVLEKWSDFTNYASYFNNSLFELPGDRVRYERIFCRSVASQIKVLPLPEKGRLESFSGLFAPVRIESAVEPTEGEVGQVMTLEVRVNSEVDGALLEIPDLSLQPGFRNHFWVSPDPITRWREDGRDFVTRFRPLTTSIRALPALEFQVFDPEEGRYEILRTRLIPMKIREGDQGSHFDVRSIPGAANVLERNYEGIWHNERSGIMNEVVDATVRILADWFWFWLLLGPAVFLVMRPRMLEWRRRADDPSHARRMAVFRRFRRAPGLETFRDFVAELLGMDSKALTGVDVTSALREVDAAPTLLKEVAAVFDETDQERYDPATKGKPASRAWVDLAKRIQGQLMCALLLAVALTGVERAAGDEWRDAEELFDRALAVPPSEDAQPEFVAAALAFEQCAEEDRLAGLAWMNAGNAWFKSGELGRAIASYRRAKPYRPFDRELDENLSAARALCVDAMSGEVSSVWWRWPLPLPFRWQTASLAMAWVLLWLLLLLRQRYPARWIKVVGLGLWLMIGVLAVSVVSMTWLNKEEGVVIASEVVGRKGPGYGYQPSFQGRMHQGLEFSRGEFRGSWVEMVLADGSRAWVPMDAVELMPR